MALSVTPVFQSGTLRIALSPDSRGYVRFNLSKLNPDSANTWSPLTSQDNLTCEELPELVKVALMACDWIPKNCLELHAPDGRHMYYQFMED